MKNNKIYKTGQVLTYYYQKEKSLKPKPVIINHSYARDKLAEALPEAYVECDINRLTPEQIQALEKAYDMFIALEDKKKYLENKLNNISESGNNTAFPRRFDGSVRLVQGKLMDRRCASAGYLPAEKHFIRVGEDGHSLEMCEIVTEQGNKVAKRIAQLPEVYLQAFENDPLNSWQRKFLKENIKIPVDGALFYANFVEQSGELDDVGHENARLSIGPVCKSGHHELSKLDARLAGVFVGVMLPDGRVQNLLVTLSSGGWQMQQEVIPHTQVLSKIRGHILPDQVPDSFLELLRVPDNEMECVEEYEDDKDGYLMLEYASSPSTQSDVTCIDEEEKDTVRKIYSRDCDVADEIETPPACLVVKKIKFPNFGNLAAATGKDKSHSASSSYSGKKRESVGVLDGRKEKRASTGSAFAMFGIGFFESNEKFESIKCVDINDTEESDEQEFSSLLEPFMS